mmetsp:Transcript_153616/g.268653  ORF Transcript_153616/g.268653 Transcript_153616/m.268653 type:complete len:435 (-) Transcript_153616:119-1423(-)
MPFSFNDVPVQADNFLLPPTLIGTEAKVQQCNEEELLTDVQLPGSCPQTPENRGRSGSGNPRGACPVVLVEPRCQASGRTNCKDMNEKEDSSEDEDLTCSICLSYFCDPRSLPCGHTFCYACLIQANMMSPSGHQCPLCRRSLPNGVNLMEAPESSLGTRMRDTVPTEVYEARLTASRAQVADLVSSSQRRLQVFRGPRRCTVGRKIVVACTEASYNRMVQRQMWGAKYLLYCPPPGAPAAGSPAVLVGIVSRLIRGQFVGLVVEEVTIRQTWSENEVLYAECMPGVKTLSQRQTARELMAGAPHLDDDLPHCPVFCSTEAQPPAQGKSIDLRLSAPSDLILTERMSPFGRSSACTFLWAPTEPKEGDEALLMKVSRVARGKNCVVLCGVKQVASVTMRSVWVEQFTGGLHFAAYERQRDRAAKKGGRLGCVLC